MHNAYDIFEEASIAFWISCFLWWQNFYLWFDHIFVTQNLHIVCFHLTQKLFLTRLWRWEYDWKKCFALMQPRVSAIWRRFSCFPLSVIEIWFYHSMDPWFNIGLISKKAKKFSTFDQCYKMNTNFLQCFQKSNLKLKEKGNTDKFNT